MHRDIKPLNIIFSGADRRFKLIDLGAAADLRTGTNYVPDESILDPAYCPPEQVGVTQAQPVAEYSRGPVSWAWPSHSVQPIICPSCHTSSCRHFVSIVKDIEQLPWLRTPAGH